MPHHMGKGHCQMCSIRHLSIFAELPVERLDELKGFSPSVMTFEAQETVYNQADAAEVAFTLRAGVVKLLRTLPSGRVQIVRVLHTGDLFGFEGFINPEYHHTAIPLTRIEVCRLPLEELLGLKKQNAEIENMMMKRWLTHINYAEDMLVELGAKKTSERLASFLVRWCDKVKSSQQPGWSPLYLSRNEIGELLGMTLETVSRALSDWKRRGLIAEQRGMIRIESNERLYEVAGSSGNG